jgi:hypothetical protein
MWNICLFLAAVLQVGLKKYDNLQGAVGNLSSYQTGRQLLDDSNDLASTTAFINTVRDKIAFHIDEDVFKDVIKRNDFAEKELFVTGTGAEMENHYYPLADVMTLSYLFHSDACLCCRGVSEIQKNEQITRLFSSASLFNKVASKVVEEFALTVAGLRLLVIEKEAR